MANEQDNVLMYAVGDVYLGHELVGREQPDSIFDFVAPIFRGGDISFVGCEMPYSERGRPQPSPHGVPVPRRTRNAYSLGYAGFNIATLANNHVLDLGPEGLFDTIDLLKKQNIVPFGAGANLKEARRPGVIERKGTKVAFLGYNSVGPHGFEATEESPGNVPMRAKTLYDPIDYQPGTPCQVLTYADADDLDALLDDVKKAREVADVVVISIHWGLHHFEALLSMYQQQIAYAAIDAGADLILGCHDHVCKGMEVYKGKAIFYGMGNFAVDKPLRPKAEATKWDQLERLLYDMEYDPEYLTYAYPPESQISFIVKCVIADKGIQKVSYLPVLVTKTGQPKTFGQGQPESERVVSYLRAITENQGLNARFTWDGDEVVVTAGDAPSARLGPSLLRFAPVFRRT